jgi:hypothetical protein
MCFFKYNTDGDQKDKAVRNANITFQARNFMRCQLLSYWIRWGNYSIDTRVLSKELGLSDPNPIVDETTLGFFVGQVIEKVGDRDFLDLCNQMLSKWNDEQAEKAAARTDPESDDDLPF